MRIRVLGNCDSAKAVRGYLIDGGLLVDDQVYSYTVEIEEVNSTIPVVDGIDCKLESAIVNAIALLGNTQILLDRPGANRSDTHIRIGVPRSFTTAQKDAVERGIRGGFENLFGPVKVDAQTDVIAAAIVKVGEMLLAEQRKREAVPWWRRFFS